MPHVATVKSFQKTTRRKSFLVSVIPNSTHFHNGRIFNKYQLGDCLHLDKVAEDWCHTSTKSKVFWSLQLLPGFHFIWKLKIFNHFSTNINQGAGISPPSIKWIGSSELHSDAFAVFIVGWHYVRDQKSKIWNLNICINQENKREKGDSLRQHSAIPWRRWNN